MFPPLKNLTKERKRLKKSEEIAEKNNIGVSPQKECKCKRFKKKRKDDDTEQRQQNSGK